MSVLGAPLTCCRQVEGWVFRGIASPCVVTVDQRALWAKDRTYWTHACTLPKSEGRSGSSLPLFSELMKTALAAGTQISLLKLCHPKVYPWIPGTLWVHLLVPGTLWVHPWVLGTLRVHPWIPGTLRVHLWVPGTLRVHPWVHVALRTHP